MDIEYLLWLQGIRESLPQVVQVCLEFLGSKTAMAAVLVVPCLVYWCIDKAVGTLALLSYAGSSLVNQLVKNTVCCYRPWVRDARVMPEQGALVGASGYSFPSAHTQSAASILGGIGWGWRRTKRWPLVAVLAVTVLVGLSRNILGVHAPQDVIVAFVEGWVFVVLADWLLAWIGRGEGRDLRVLVWGLVACGAFLAYVTLKPYPMEYRDGVLLVDPREMLIDCYELAGAYLGILIGWFCERRYVCFSTDSVVLAQGARRLLVGIAVLLIVHVPVGHAIVAVLGGYWGELVRYTLTFSMAVAGVPKLFMWLESRS